ACADSWDCTRTCIASFDNLYKSDFTISFQLLCLVILHTRDTHMVVWKWCSFIICLTINILMSNYVLDPPKQHNPWIPVVDYYVIVAVICLVLISVRAFLQLSVFKEEIRQFRIWYLGFALICASIVNCPHEARRVLVGTLNMVGSIRCGMCLPLLRHLRDC